MNVVIYARFSSHSQTEQSIEGQLKVCNEYAAANNYVVVGEYIDRAQSGTTDNRTEFQRMIATAILLKVFSSTSSTALLVTAMTALLTRQN